MTLKWPLLIIVVLIIFMQFKLHFLRKFDTISMKYLK